MSKILINCVSFAYEGNEKKVFDHVSCTLDSDWRLGLIGRNGRGKTTLLHLLMNKFEFTGEILHTVNFKYFPFPLLDQNKICREIAEELAPLSEDWRIRKNMNLLKMDAELIECRYAELSGGEQTKFLLAVLFSEPNGFLLLDEPTNHLDAAARQDVADFLQKQRGFILVSHDRELLDRCTDHTMSINRDAIEVISGNFSVWWREKERRDWTEIKQNEKLKREIERLEYSANRSASWANKTEKGKFGSKNSGLSVDRGYVGHKAAKMMQLAKNTENRKAKMIEEKSSLLKNIESDEELKINQSVYFSDTLIEVKNLSLFYGTRQITDHLNFSVKKGEKVLLKGKNGSGKSSVIKLLCGENIAYLGEIVKNNQLIISYLPQKHQFTESDVAEFIAKYKIDAPLFFAILAKLALFKEQLNVPLYDLSAGQQRKILLAKSLSQRAHLYIWDEPLNYIDVFSRIQIENLLRSTEAPLLFVEHDEQFIKNVATKIIEF